MEEKFLTVMNDYFVKIRQNKSKQASENYIKSIENLDFSEGEYSLDIFSLIKDKWRIYSITFIYDDRAQKAYNMVVIWNYLI